MFRLQGGSRRDEREDHASLCEGRLPKQGLNPEPTSRMSLTGRFEPLSNYTDRRVCEGKKGMERKMRTKSEREIRVRSVAMTNPLFLQRRLCLLWLSSLRDLTLPAPHFCALSMCLYSAPQLIRDHPMTTSPNSSNQHAGSPVG